ncbi:GNAT family N-acetyltransferase [uncultured Exiguobacterium sp.]|uniref:GNAT family N-acetyltransferase n=1 Tax=uncultured Exiguobacterium sp. TaxID=202669 RepID=UPI0025D27CD8|nr:GNAT family N-acetyltransferase [uncultured Exiguobacterium sp.]
MQTMHHSFDTQRYNIRPARPSDAEALAALREALDAETEYFDRMPGEEVMTANNFVDQLRDSPVLDRILVVEREEQIIAYARCRGFELKRFAHKASFGLGVLRSDWGQGIGTQLTIRMIAWAKAQSLLKIQLEVVETNHGAIRLYQRHGFQEEGRLRHDRLLSDGCYYDTVLMGLAL